ncbi:MAG TPA: hypothetical protein VMU07_01670 [Candidatus Paceibacterota bacterium]|nr:hypothetical protein [Candidatus Paceibacterota bacterium]
MPNFIHKELAAGKWFQLPLMEQLGNIGSEVGRACKSQGGDAALYNSAVDRALDLFDLTLADPRWRGRYDEIARARELFCDAAFDNNIYKTTLADLETYFLQFAIAAQMGRR